MSAFDNKNFVRLYCLMIPRAACTLRRIFRETWLTVKGQPWADTEDQGKIFQSGVEGKVLVAVTERQKRLLLSGDIELWNLKLLCHVLTRMDFGEEIFTQTDVMNFQTLEEERKNIVRRDRFEMVMTDEEFNHSWKIFETILIYFGHSALDLVNLKYILIEPEMELDRQLHPTCIDKINPQDFINYAVDEFFDPRKYLEAILMFSKFFSLNVPELSTYDKAFIYLARSQASNCTGELKQRAMAKIDAKRAIELRPTWPDGYFFLEIIYHDMRKEDKAADVGTIASTLKTLKAEAIEMENMVCLNEEQIKEFDEIEWPIEITEKTDTEDIEWLYAEQVAQAVINKQAWGMFKLALMLSEGARYVVKNPKQAMQLLFQVAAEAADENGQVKLGVAKAEHVLGYCYNNGLNGLEQRLDDAIDWYIRAAEHGHIASYNSLADLYYNKKWDVINAIKYWQLSASQGNIEAFENLVDYYLSEGSDVDKATEWYRKGAEYCSQFAEKYRDQINDMEELISKVVQWEIGQGLDISDGEKTRISRYLKAAEGFVMEPIENGIMLPLFATTSPARYDLNVLEPYVKKGCPIAEKLKEAVQHFYNAQELLCEYKGKAPPEFIQELADSIRIEATVPVFSPPDRVLATLVVGNVLRKREISNLDKDARICHAYLHSNAIYDMHQFLWNCIDKYPDEVTFRVILCYVFAFLGKYNLGVEVADFGLTLFPNHWDLLYARASNLRRGFPRQKQKIINAFKEFLNHVPKSHFKVPEAYYTIAYEILFMDKSEGQVGMEYYNCGLEAEKWQLPMFVPYNFPLKGKVYELLNNRCLIG